MNLETLFDTLPVYGWLTLPEAELLYRVAGGCQGSILEVGNYYGRSACLLATLGRPLYCVDPFDNFDSDEMTGDKIEKAFWINVKKRNLSNIIQERCKIEHWQIKQVEFAYLDGDHTYTGTHNQINVALKAGAKEICVHDYPHPPIQQAIKDSPLSLIEVVERMVYCRLQ